MIKNVTFVILHVLWFQGDTGVAGERGKDEITLVIVAVTAILDLRRVLILYITCTICIMLSSNCCDHVAPGLTGATGPLHEDIDECLTGNNSCAHTCVNTFHGHHCACLSGYELDVNGFDCNGKKRDSRTVIATVL